MTRGIRIPGSLEHGKNPKAGTTLHHAGRNQNVLVVIEIDLVLRRNSPSIGQGITGQMAIDSYVYRSRAEGDTAEVQHSPIEVLPVFPEMPEARASDHAFEHRSLTDGTEPDFPAGFRPALVFNRTKVP